MKKIASLLIALVMLVSASFAQAKPETKKQTKPVQKAQPATTAKPSTSATPLKKDGTPDKRYKVNKDSSHAKAVPLKKDGTPDMRHKENKKPVKG